MKAHKLTEDLYYYSPIHDDNIVAEAGTIIRATGKLDHKAGEQFLVNGELIWIVDAEEIIEEVEA